MKCYISMYSLSLSISHSLFPIRSLPYSHHTSLRLLILNCSVSYLNLQKLLAHVHIELHATDDQRHTAAKLIDCVNRVAGLLRESNGVMLVHCWSVLQSLFVLIV